LIIEQVSSVYIVIHTQVSETDSSLHNVKQRQYCMWDLGRQYVLRKNYKGLTVMYTCRIDI